MAVLSLISRLRIIYSWAMNTKDYEFCSNLFGQRMVHHDRVVNFKPVILPLSISFLLLWLSAASLPERGPFPFILRLAILPYLLATAFDIAVNKQYSLGSPLRDVIFPFWGCLIAFRIIDMAVVSLWDESPAPKWIKPGSLEEKPEHPSTMLTPYKCETDKITTEDQNSEKCKPNSQTIRKARDVWRPVAYPPLLSFDRALYALDVVILNRPGTPWLFPWRLRSLDWSLAALNGTRKEVLEFGRPEWPFWLALIQQIFHFIAHGYIRSVNLDGERAGVQQLWGIRLSEQVVVTFALGSVVAFSTSLEEAIAFPLLIKFGIFPKTALLGHSRRAILSKGLVDLWGYRWHRNWRRSFVRMARLFPRGLTSSGNAFWAFFLSGVMHSIMFARAYPTPTLRRPCSFIPILWEPGMMLFFVAQGVGALIEKTCFSDKTPKIARMAWMYFILIGAGRYLTNSMVVKGWLSAYEWNQMNFGNVISDLFGFKPPF